MHDQIIEDALNAACLSVQDNLGVKTGDVASMFFCGANADKFVELFKAYIKAELLMKGNTTHAENCFPDWTAPEGFELPEGWKDDSWHNDAMPKFVSPCGFYFLWVDYENPDHREWGRNFKRYLIVKVQEPFNVGVSDEEQVLLSDSFDDVRQFINKLEC